MALFLGESSIAEREEAKATLVSIYRPCEKCWYLILRCQASVFRLQVEVKIVGKNVTMGLQTDQVQSIDPHQQIHPSPSSHLELEKRHDEEDYRHLWHFCALGNVLGRCVFDTVDSTMSTRPVATASNPLVV
jgi:hypothetical protein